MKLAVSNLAWPNANNHAAFRLMADLGVQGVEVAPTRIAPWEALHPATLATYRAELASYGLTTSSLQAIFFGRPEVQLLADPTAFAAMAEHLDRVATIGAELGASVMVFGAPGQRRRGTLDPATTTALATERMALLGAIAYRAGMIIGVEPVPAAYNGDFLCTWQEVLALVTAIDQPGVRVHLDTSCVTLGGGSIAEAIAACHPVMAHMHAAEPNLAAFAPPVAPHAEAAAALATCHYDRWLAIEMREQPGEPLAAVEQAVRAVNTFYAAALAR